MTAFATTVASVAAGGSGDGGNFVSLDVPARALYLCLSGIADKFRYLNHGLGVILAFVGIKMLIVEWYHLPTWASLGFIAVVLTITIWLSVRADRLDPQDPAELLEVTSKGPDGPIPTDSTDPAPTPEADRER